MENDLEKVRQLLKKSPEVRFAYLFGSMARDEGGETSDLDVAVYVREGVSTFDFRLGWMEKLASLLGRDDVDLVVLNEAPPVLCYEIVRDGRLLVDSKEARVAFEARVLDEYFDTEALRKTQQAYLKSQLSGDSHG